MKARDCSNVEISLDMLISERTVAELARRVKRKMSKVTFI